MQDTIKALFLTKYSREGASSRYRFLQYFPLLEEGGIRCTHSPLTDAAYLEHLYNNGKGSLSDFWRLLFRRMNALRSIDEYDIVVIEYEILPYFPPIFESLLKSRGIPYIVNYDDAIFFRYSQHPNSLVRALLGRKIDAVMKGSDLVIAGNDYLASYARTAGAENVEILPTVVDLSRYPVSRETKNEVFTIGWIGSPSTAKYVKEIAPALAEICAGGRARVRLIGSGPVSLEGVPLDVRPWSEAAEVSDLESCDVGIMPLADGLWERGKCGLKLIQYMASALGVVVSPVGVNQQLVEDGINGFLARTKDEWVRALGALRDDVSLRTRMGAAGRKRVEAEYSLAVAAPKMAGFIRRTARPSKKIDKKASQV